MNKYSLMTEYISYLDEDKYGEWISDSEGDGSKEKPFQFPFVCYSQMVHSFLDDVNEFVNKHPEMHLTSYGDILKEHNIEWSSESMSQADVSKLDAQGIMAMIVAAMRADHFCEGALLGFFKDGSIKKWLDRLQELDS